MSPTRRLTVAGLLLKSQSLYSLWQELCSREGGAVCTMAQRHEKSHLLWGTITSSLSSEPKGTGRRVLEGSIYSWAIFQRDLIYHVEDFRCYGAIIKKLLAEE